MLGLDLPSSSSEKSAALLSCWLPTHVVCYNEERDQGATSVVAEEDEAARLHCCQSQAVGRHRLLCTVPRALARAVLGQHREDLRRHGTDASERRADVRDIRALSLDHDIGLKHGIDLARRHCAASSATQPSTAFLSESRDSRHLTRAGSLTPKLASCTLFVRRCVCVGPDMHEIPNRRKQSLSEFSLPLYVGFETRVCNIAQSWLDSLTHQGRRPDEASTVYVQEVGIGQCFGQKQLRRKLSTAQRADDFVAE